MENILKRMLLFLVMLIIPVGVFAEVQFSVTPSSLEIETGKTKTFTITTSDINGTISIASTDNDVALVNKTGYGFEAGSAGETRVETITVTGVNPGTAQITISITATDTNSEPVNLESKTINVTVKNISTNNNLSNIKINGNSISNFNSSITNYNIEVNDATITITATPQDTKAKVTGDGTKALNYGNNKIEIKVIAENESIKTYTLNINRKDTRDTNNNLLDLTVDKAKLNYDKAKTSYDIEVESDVDKITINAVPESSKAVISGHGLIKLSYGNNKIEVKVTAENESVKVYTINVNRKDTRDSNNYLSSIKLDKEKLEFDKETTTYSINVNNSINKLVVSATAESDKATVTGDGEKTLSVGSNKIEIKVTAENGDIKVYTLTINRLEPIPGSDFIKSLTIDDVELNFDPNVINYDVTIDDQTSLNFNYVLDEGVDVIIDGNENLENNSVVTLTATKGDISIEYTFNIIKPQDTIVTENKESGSKLWIYIIVGVLAILLLIGTFAKAKEKKNKETPKKDTDNPLESIQDEINNEISTSNIVSDNNVESNNSLANNTIDNFEDIEKL